MSIAKLNGTLVYVQVNEPKACYVVEKGEEWKASIVVSEDDAEAWDDAYPKQTAKQVKTSEFESIYKIPAPFPDQRKQYVITVRKNTKLGNGNQVPIQYQPKVFQKKGNTLVDVTTSVLVANGSTGSISIETYDGKMGTFARLKNVLVIDLIEYKKQEGGVSDGSEFGFEVAYDDNGGSVKVPPSAKAKSKAVPQLEDDSESPF